MWYQRPKAREPATGKQNATRTKPLARRPTGSRVIRSRIGCWSQEVSVTKLLQRLHDELVRRDYAATTIRSYVQIVDAFRQHTRRAPRSARPRRSSGATTSICSRSGGSPSGPWSPQICRAAVLLPARAEAARREGGPAVSEAATPLAGRPQSRRGAAPDRRREESLSPHAAADALRRGLAPQRSCAS